MEHQTCGRCGRKLKSEKSKQEGFGPVCLRKHVAAMAEAEQKQAEMNEYLAGECSFCDSDKPIVWEDVDGKKACSDCDELEDSYASEGQDIE